VHLWQASLITAEDHSSLLSPTELLRAASFHFRQDRARFIAGRGLLRSILGRYLNVEPRDLQFTSGPNGKPELTGAGTCLHFNLSHSGDLMLLAVSHAHEVGVDVEQVREGLNTDELAQNYFPAAEAEELRLLPDVERTLRFFELWTATEARLKASGEGLANGTTIINPDRWSLLSLTPADGYAAALAVEGAEFALTCWTWPK
jgi:4'-phosphopantetheinyl transferase